MQFLFLSSTAQNCCLYLLKDVSFGEYTWALIVHFPSWKPLRFKVKAPEVFFILMQPRFAVGLAL